MQSQNSEVIIRRAVFSDRWQIYKSTELIYLDASLGFGSFALVYMTRTFFRMLELATQGYPQAVVFYLVPYLIMIAGMIFFLLFRNQLAKAYHWSNTWVAERRNRLIAIACVQQQGTYSTLTRLFVTFGNRGRGIGSQLVQRLVEQTPRPIYLICDRSLMRFYTRFDFERILHRDAPREFRNKFLATVLVLR